MDVSVNINITEGKFSVVYPRFNEGNNTWKVKANPNGDIEINNRKYPYLFYECDSFLPKKQMKDLLLKIQMLLNSLKKN